MLRQYGIVVSRSNSAPKSGIVLAHEPRRRHRVAGAAVLPSGQPRPRAGAGVAALLARLDQTTGRTRTMTPVATRRESKTGYRGRHWLTRPHPGVDRMSSAWLIRRFIDPQASFVFGDHGSAPDAIPFDTFEAEFGHHGSDCTFETLCQRFAIEDAAALHIGRIVHDLDLKRSE